MRVRGIDHVDVRVSSLAAVEAFYDALLPALGLTVKSASHVDAEGEWRDIDDAHPRTAIEYNVPAGPGEVGWFIGFIEAPGMVPSGTRVAFALDREEDLREVERLVLGAGGRVVEWSIDARYPALFFEDPAGTRLEMCARRPRS